MGLRPLSAGAGIAEVAYAKAASLAAAFLQTGVSDPVTAESRTYSTFNALLSGARSMTR